MIPNVPAALSHLGEVVRGLPPEHQDKVVGALEWLWRHLHEETESRTSAVAGAAPEDLARECIGLALYSAALGEDKKGPILMHISAYFDSIGRRVSSDPDDYDSDRGSLIWPAAAGRHQDPDERGGIR